MAWPAVTAGNWAVLTAEAFMLEGDGREPSHSSLSTPEPASDVPCFADTRPRGCVSLLRCHTAVSVHRFGRGDENRFCPLVRYSWYSLQSLCTSSDLLPACLWALINLQFAIRICK